MPWPMTNMTSPDWAASAELVRALVKDATSPMPSSSWRERPLQHIKYKLNLFT